MVLAQSGDFEMKLKNTQKRDVCQVIQEDHHEASQAMAPLENMHESQAMASLEDVHESNGDKAASSASSSALTSTVVSSSSSLSSSSSSLSNEASVAVNKSGWKGMNLCKPPLPQQSMRHPIGVQSARTAEISHFSHEYLVTNIPCVAAADVEISTTSKILKALLISKRRLRFEPSSKLYFPYEAGVLAPGDSLVATVVKFIELPKSLEPSKDIPLKRRTRDKFKIVSMKIHEGLEFTPELFDEHRELVTVEQVLQVVLLDPKQPSPQLERLKGLIAEYDAAQEAESISKGQKRDDENKMGNVSVLEEWRQRKLARQQAK